VRDRLALTRPLLRLLLLVLRRRLLLRGFHRLLNGRRLLLRGFHRLLHRGILLLLVLRPALDLLGILLLLDLLELGLGASLGARLGGAGAWLCARPIIAADVETPDLLLETHSVSDLEDRRVVHTPRCCGRHHAQPMHVARLAVIPRNDALPLDVLPLRQDAELHD
jgi:hypothetical protein